MTVWTVLDVVEVSPPLLHLLFLRALVVVWSMTSGVTFVRSLTTAFGTSLLR